ncbi:MAG TPA: ketoacyl-ACP synthase III [Steroidobacteraceae bacterium]|nr:ketoacyl-ACP synthase III [Steroidobacteraceae bacterium]
MARTSIGGMAMRGVMACVPEKELSNERDYPWFEPTEIRKITAMAGIKSRRMADPDVCTSDLCAAAGKALLQRLDWDPQSVDALILVTQTPDYVMPSSSCLIQHQLGLSESCAAFDVGLGCSAYVYGAWLAHTLVASGGCRRVLLMTGETLSKLVDPKDRTTALLFGDAGSATAFEAVGPGEAEPAHYVMMTDGAGAGDLIVPGGMFRERFPEDRARYMLRMDGMHVFEFTRNRVPPLIQELFSMAGAGPADYDYFIFHQANEYLIKFLAGKAGLNLAQVPFSIGRFGNTGAASLPLTLALAGAPPGIERDYRIMLLGFGVGLSWGGVSMRVPRDCVLEHFVYGASG